MDYVLQMVKEQNDHDEDDIDVDNFTYHILHLCTFKTAF